MGRKLDVCRPGGAAEDEVVQLDVGGRRRLDRRLHLPVHPRHVRARHAQPLQHRDERRRGGGGRGRARGGGRRGDGGRSGRGGRGDDGYRLLGQRGGGRRGIGGRGWGGGGRRFGRPARRQPGAGD